MPRGFGKRLAVVAGGLVAGLVLVEVLLQIGAFAAWSVSRERREPAAVPRGDGRVVLCVGDSFTFGIGASPDLAYPDQLQTALDETAPGVWSVVNAGWPGRTSGELRGRLPALLEESRPDYVCILVGRNNKWTGGNGPAAADVGDPGAWVWRWRTARLVAIVRQAIRDRAEPEAPAPAAEPEAAPADLRVEGDPVATLRNVRARLDETERFPGGARLVTPLRDDVRRLDDPDTSALLADVLGRLGLLRLAEEEAMFAIERHGETAPLCQALVRPLIRDNRVEEAHGWAVRAVELDPDDPDSRRALAVAHWFRNDLAAALAETLRAWERGAGDEYLERQLRRRQLATTFEPAAFREIVDDLGFPEEMRARALRIYGRSREQGALEAGLLADLEALVVLAEEAGARPVLLSYPWSGRPSTIDEAIEQAARRHGTVLVDLVAPFRRALETRPREELFVPDGHCSDEGYRIMAREVARALVAQTDAR